eukprot:499713-Rhodomonas_salina.1
MARNTWTSHERKGRVCSYSASGFLRFCSQNMRLFKPTRAKKITTIATRQVTTVAASSRGDSLAVRHASISLTPFPASNSNASEDPPPPPPFARRAEGSLEFDLGKNVGRTAVPLVHTESTQRQHTQAVGTNTKNEKRPLMQWLEIARALCDATNICRWNVRYRLRWHCVCLGPKDGEESRTRGRSTRLENCPAVLQGHRHARRVPGIVSASRHCQTRGPASGGVARTLADVPRKPGQTGGAIAVTWGDVFKTVLEWGDDDDTETMTVMTGDDDDKADANTEEKVVAAEEEVEKDLLDHLHQPNQNQTYELTVVAAPPPELERLLAAAPDAAAVTAVTTACATVVTTVRPMADPTTAVSTVAVVSA